jgi:thiamine biosynthesis protein ThiS
VGEGVNAAPSGAAHEASATLHVTVGGTLREVAAGTTVAELLASLGAAGRPCAVEINRSIVPRAAHGSHPLREGDAIEIVGFVGGG